MPSEAQRLIGISLRKIAESRTHRGGVSLHRNLLVATVLQKARHSFMEEAYNFLHYPAAPAQLRPVPADELVRSSEEECTRCGDKENQPPELTYLDLDRRNLKRRRAVAEWETEEAVQSILPKKAKAETDEEAAEALSDAVAREVVEAEGAMEIDRITSLVSIFSFSMGGGETNKLNRSVSTPDLCAAQAKDAGDAVQQRTFLAMTV